MKINNPNVRKWDRISINRRRNIDGSPSDGLVISQRGAFILLSPAEWLELRECGNHLLGINQ